MPRCCPKCYLFEGCENQDECCEECDFYADGDCALSKEEVM